MIKSEKIILKNNNYSINQQGSVLLFSVMVMVFLLTISLSVAQVIFAELKISGFHSTSQTAYYASESGLEKSLFSRSGTPTPVSLIAGIDYYSTLEILNGTYFLNSRGRNLTSQRENKLMYTKPKVVASYLRSYAVDSAGNLFVTGSCQYGEFGFGETNCNGWGRDWTLVLRDVVDVAAGFRHSVALKSDGTVWTTGGNWSGQLGLGDNVDRYEWTKTNIDNVIQIATAEEATLALKSDGTVWSTGNNSSGELGIGDAGSTYNTWRQARISSTEYLTDIIKVGGSQLSWHSGALRKDGTLFMAGDNYSGQFGLGYKNSDRNLYFIPVKTSIRKFHLSYYHSLAVDYLNNVWGAGDNSSGQLGLGSQSEQLTWRVTKSSISDIRAGAYYSLLLDYNGRIWGSGEGHLIGKGWSFYTNTFVDTGVSDVINFSAAWGGSNIVKMDGSYMATGDNSDQALGVNNPDSNCCAIWTENPNFKL